MFLKLPGLWFLFSFEVVGQFLLKFSKGRPEVVKDLQSDDDLVQSLFNLNLYL